MQDIVVVGGGIGGLYCARELANANSGRIVVLEAADRFGGRIETGKLGPGPFQPHELHNAEYGPMRFELKLQDHLRLLLEQYGIETKPFSPPASPEPPVTYPLPEGECSPCGIPLSSLELLKLGIFRLFAQKADVVEGTKKDPRPKVELGPAGREWLDELTHSKYEQLRKTWLMPGTSQPLRNHGFWNALYGQLSPMAVAKILHFGTFYHLMPDNPNAAEWAIFWLRLFQLGDEPLSTIPSGVDELSNALRKEVERLGVGLEPGHNVVAVRPVPSGARVEVEVEGGETRVADHVVLALPKQPLLALAENFPDPIREHLDSVIAFPLLKVFCVTETPPWWKTEPPQTQRAAWNVPTREIHYLPPKDANNHAPDTTLVLFYTDRPATAFWQVYLRSPDAHEEAEVNENEELKKMLALVLFKLHWDWAKEIAGIADRSGRDSLADPNGLSISRAITQFFTDIVADVEPSDPIYPELARRSPALVGYPAEVLFTPQEIHVWQQQAIHDYAIRDWSRAPYGAGCHAWAPGAKSWEVRADLSAFGFSGQEDVKNLHICGEAYSDYQGFIEGALRSAADAAQTI